MSSASEHGLGPRLRELRQTQGVGPDEMVHRLKNRGAKITISGLHQIERGERVHLKEELLLEMAEVLHADPAEFPELLMIRTRRALDEEDLDAALANLRKALRARQRRAGDDPQVA